ncbi:MAG TPA: type VI secretion system protein TssA [Candidatus Acidoferrales bacterium]|nr:type VI secretion system protein TssA [Candidatus Acidoferrales bacterium]
MALPDTMLNPIPGENPSGQNLRYAPVYDKIKEARREEEELPQGDWAREIKQADFEAVIKLATEVLATKTKDLQLASWLCEALLREEGLKGFKEGLDLLNGLVTNFWDTVYPEIEDGDVELRVAPLNWVGTYLGEQVRKVPLTKHGFNFLKYVESRAVGTEEACSDNQVKMEARSAALAEGKLAPEEFDRDMASTSRAFYVELLQDLDAVNASVQALDELCNEKAGRDSPSFGNLRGALEDVQSLAASFLKTKPDPAAAAVPAPEVTEEPAEETSAESPAESTEAAAPRRRAAVSQEPVDVDDAQRRIISAIEYLRKSDPLNPAAYLALRGLRWGELRAGGISPNEAQLDPPPSETRQQLKRLAMEGQWQELLDAVEAAMALPCGRAWLDLQRYLTRAFQELGSDFDPAAKALRSSVGALISDLPELPQSTFLDDTPVANPETLAWIKEIGGAAQPSVEESPEPAPTFEQSEDDHSDAQAPDARELASQAARSGRVQEAIEILSREIAQERSGRGRFERKMQLAEICLGSRHETIAYPILKELAREIEQRKLDEWESPNLLAGALTLLFRCLSKMGADDEEKQEIYQRICRLDPVQALACLK